jgi:hypothetical protein
MKHNSIILLTFLFVFSACERSSINIDPPHTTGSGLIIKAGFECGWGSGMDSLEISRTAIKYVYYVPAHSSVPTINKSRSVSAEEWREILNDVSMDEFLKLNYNACNICVDGCDEWILILDDGISHKITFGKGSEIKSISKLQKKLAELRTEFNK